MLRRALLLSCWLGLLAPASTFPIFGGFHSVLAFGEGQGTSAQDLAAGTVPASDLNQAPLYEGLE